MTDKKGPRLSSACKRFGLSIWNGETNEFLGRTAASWGKILLFYIVFYAALTAFWVGLFSVFWKTIDLNKPKWELDESCIGTNPGIGFRPLPPSAKSGNTLIWYKSRNPEDMVYWYNSVNKFLEDYTNPNNMENVDLNCSYDRPADEGKFCPFGIESLGSCSPYKSNNEYGFPQKKPCVFLKLNKIFNWTPRVFNETGADQLTDEIERSTYEKMPEALRSKIANIRQAPMRNMIWVSCEGERPIDVENMGPLEYWPSNSFPAHYFPFKNVKGYQPPIVAVRFEKPKLGVIISIQCKVWAKNILYDTHKGKGSVSFKLMIDS